MLGSIHLGIIAACVVLFVPMGMAGWHLSRNKMLFFSGALFITLAVGVHLTPYFPSVSDFVSSVSSVVVFDTRDSCVNNVNDVQFDVKPVKGVNGSVGYTVSWGWVRSTKVISCEFQKLGRSDSSDLLNGSWVVVAGDSQARLFVVQLLELVLASERMEMVKGDLFKRHSDYRIVVNEIGMKLDFIWAPFVSNLTELVRGFRGRRNCPDVLVMGSGLWHMLRVTNVSDYGVGLRLFRINAVSLFGGENVEDVTGSADVRSPHMFWLGMPILINEMLNTKDKKEKMTDDMWHAYDREVHQSKLLRQSGAGPFVLLDIPSLTWSCGSHCTADGMHYHGAVYEAAVHIMLNALLIESHQKL